MAKTALKGAYPLDAKSIDSAVTANSAGAYALTRQPMKDNKLFVDYVGRSDSGIAGRLKDYIGDKSAYTHFMFQYATSPKDAFETECHLYHDFSPRDNSIHPDRPKNSDWKCPRCKNFG